MITFTSVGKLDMILRRNSSVAQLSMNLHGIYKNQKNMTLQLTIQKQRQQGNFQGL